jgi:hypothetical protein
LTEAQLRLDLFAPSGESAAPSRVDEGAGTTAGEPRPSSAEIALGVQQRLERARAQRQAERSFRESLAVAMKGRLGRLTLTRNRSTLVSSRFSTQARSVVAVATRRSRKIDVRVQRVFAGAQPEVIEAIARIALGDGGDSSQATVREFFARVVREERRAEADGVMKPARPVDLQPRGSFYDLEEIRDGLLPLFEEAVAVDVTWSRPPRRRSRARRRKRQCTVLLGVYVDSDRLIRIHPVLDHESVPRFVVESVMYHELLHAILPVEESGGRRCVHTPEFRRRERQYPRFEEAEHFIEKHVFRLLEKM